MSFNIDQQDEWISHARHIRSPNCDERPEPFEISLIVIHGISLPPNCYGGPYIDQLFTNSLNTEDHPYFKDISHLRVSSHLMINRQGLLTQYVPLKKRAWHAGESEFKGRKVCNDFSIGIELEGCDDESYTDSQYKVLIELTEMIRLHWPAISKDRIVGHEDIAPGRKTDPGPAFDWQRYLTGMTE
ncbi:MAG: 1,6-anhydro-N-acetylmuramyl-L-alanine amidase AmpD [Pseudomonadota bacterium]